jgi:tetratricopeptide (TPR) repeat protein
LEKKIDQQILPESKPRLVEQINSSLHSGDYSRALDLLRTAAAEFPNDNDADLSDLAKRAQEGVQRKHEADRLITESQELFAHQKSPEALQLLRQAYELDKHNSLARSILANALVEHAHSILETDWLGAETLTNQALALNPAHPTAKSIHSLIVEQKKNSPVEDWVAQAQKLQSSGDLFKALAWIAEGLAVHPDDPKLLQIHDSIQRDQGARRRQARRGDLEDLRRMELQINAAPNVAAKQALAERIQAVAAKYWTDGETLSVANGLLSGLGLAPQDGSTASLGSKGATIIFHVPRPSAPNPTRADASPVPPTPIPSGNASTRIVQPSETPPNIVPPVKLSTTPPDPQLPVPQAAAVPAAEPSAPAAKVASPSSEPKQNTKSHATTLILVSVAAIILVAITFFFTRKHYAPPVANTSSPAPTASAPAIPAPTIFAPAETTPATLPVPTPAPLSEETPKADKRDQSPAEPGHNLGSLLVVAGQDGARVFLNGELQPQLTQAGQLRLPNLELKDYVVQVSKSGFQDPPPQKIRIRKSEPAKLVFLLQPHNLQPQPRPSSLPSLASLTIQGGAPGTAVLIDQALVGTIPPDGTLSVSTVNPGDHTIELRKERFKPRQFKKTFVAGGTISLAAADTALEAFSGELKITFTPADANVAIAKGEFLKIVSSGVPLNLAPGTYTLTARTAERITRTSTLEVIAGQSKTLDLSLAPTGMSKWDNPAAWKPEKDSFIRKGGDFVLYGALPSSGTFLFSAMPAKNHPLQWVLNYTDPKNYVLCQLEDNSFHRTVIRNGQKTNEITVPDKGDKKTFRTLQIRVSPTELVHVIKQGDSWTVHDRWTQPGADLSLGKFGFYIPGNDQVALSSFSHYVDLNLR